MSVRPLPAGSGTRGSAARRSRSRFEERRKRTADDARRARAAGKTQEGEPTQHREAQVVSLRSARVIVERDQAERGLLRGETRAAIMNKFSNIEVAVDAAFESCSVASLGVHDGVQVSSHQFEQAGLVEVR